MARNLLRARHSKRWRLRTHSACEKSVHFPILINTDYLFIVTLLMPKPKCEPSVLSRITAAFLLSNILVICTPRGQALVCTNCLNFWRNLPALLPRAILFSELRKTDVKCGACILTNAQVITRSTSFAYLPLWHLKLHLKFDSIKVWIKESRCYYTPWHTSLPDKVTPASYTQQIMFIAHLHQRLYTIGWMNLNVVVSHMMHLVHVQLSCYARNHR